MIDVRDIDRSVLSSYSIGREIDKVHIGANLKPLEKIAAWHDKMISGLSAVMLVQGDSTGNDGTDWVQIMLNATKLRYPSHTVVTKLWSDTRQCYDPVRTQGMSNRMQIGSDGDAYVLKEAISGEYIDVNIQDNHQIAGDIDIRVKIDLDSYNPASEQVIIGRFGTADPQRIWWLVINSSGLPYFSWSPDGTWNNRKTVYGVSLLSELTPGTPRWLRVTLDVDNESGGHDVKFFLNNKTVSEVVWQQLGSTITNTGTTSIYTSNTKDIEIGSSYNGFSRHMTGKIYEAQVLNGIEGVPVLSADFDLAVSNSNTYINDTEGNTINLRGGITVHGSPGLLILNSSTSGKAISYSKDTTRFSLQTPLVPDLSWINYCHNEGYDIDYTQDYQDLIDLIVAKYTDTGIICTAQNPKKDASAYSEAHAIRTQQIIDLSTANNYMLVDVFNLFKSYVDWETDLMGDDTHPSVAGYEKWGFLADKLLKRY